MTFRLSIDGPAWDRTLHEVVARTPGLVPVIKGNGYGFSATLLAGRCTDLGVPAVAVGVAAEIEPVRKHFAGDVLVMAPLQLSEIGALVDQAGFEPGVLRTVAHPDVLRAVAEMADPPRVVIELDSPVHRHGITRRDLLDLVAVLRRVPLAGIALHLPVDQAAAERLQTAESALRSVATLRSAGVEPGTLWISHLSVADVTQLSRQDPLTQIRSRVGTRLWLGDRGASFSASGTVLDTHAIPRNQTIGYRQRRSAAGTLLVVSGGTAHGVGLYSSVAHGGWRDMARAAVSGAAHATGLTPSPFHWAGRRLRYADVPHMQVSMLLVPVGTPAPPVGQRLPCDVRMTVTTFDEIEIRDSPGTDQVGRESQSAD